MAHLPVFISRAHYGLEDLRGSLADYLSNIGCEPLLSSEAGFNDGQGLLSPYASCLKTLEKSLMVVGVIDKRYGQSLNEWGEYSDYIGLSPTHGEIKHAIKLQKRINIFVRKSVSDDYRLYRQDKEGYKNLKSSNKTDPVVLEMYQEIRTNTPSYIWIEEFDDVRDIQGSLYKRLLNDVNEFWIEREARRASEISQLLDNLLHLDSEEERNRLITFINGITKSSDITSVLDSLEKVTNKGLVESKGDDKSSIMGINSALLISMANVILPVHGLMPVYGATLATFITEYLRAKKEQANGDK